MARQYHPDVSKVSDAEAQFKDIAEAYAILKDPEKRARYDELGQRQEGAEFTPPSQWRSEHEARGAQADAQDLSDLLEELGRRHGFGRSSPTARHGLDYERSIDISLRDAHQGSTLTLDLEEGEARRRLEVKIPAGTVEGQKLKLRGRGGRGRNGGSDGDIYLHVAIKPDAVFRLDKRDLYCDLALAPWEAALGTELEMSTLDGAVMLVVPPGTGSGRKLRLRGRGLFNPKGASGDLYALVHIDIAPSLSEEERALYLKLSQISRFNPRVSPTMETCNAMS